MIGGSDGRSTLNSVCALNLTTGRISSAASVLHARIAHATAVSESNIFAFGSMGARLTSDATFNGEIYGPQTNT